METGSTMYAAHADVIYDLELELLDDRLPPQLSETLAQLFQSKKTGTYVLEALEVESPPKRRKPVDDAAVASLEAIGADAPNSPCEHETQTHEDVLGDIAAPPVTAKHCGLTRECNESFAQQQSQVRRRKPRKQNDVHQDRKHPCLRAYQNALKQARRELCCNEEAYVRARVAGRKAGEAWVDVRLWGNGV